MEEKEKFRMQNSYSALGEETNKEIIGDELLN